MRIAVDTGGTFTDCIFVRGGRLEILKVLSQPKNPAAAIAGAVGKCLSTVGIARTEPLDLVCGTTVGTNALLERRGGRVTLVTTEGFEDVLEIGRQARPKLYDFFVEKPQPLVPPERRLGARERVAADGSVVTALAKAEVRRIARLVRKTGADTVAVCFLFSFRDPEHEWRVAAALGRAGDLVSVSYEILPEFREFERTSTTVINAYLAPVMSGYLGEAPRWAPKIPHLAGRAAATEVRVRVMQSNGGIISPKTASRETLRTNLSRPAGGGDCAQDAARLSRVWNVLTFGMGGPAPGVAPAGGC